MSSAFFRSALCLIVAAAMVESLAAQDAPVPVPVQTFVVVGPQNSRIEFVGAHVGTDPAPRLGGFGDFHGLVGVDLATQAVTSVQLGFEIGSIWTEFDDLTKHLLNADFFNVEKFPHASFSSTSVTPGPDGGCTVAGTMTMMGKTADISFPATCTLTDKGLVLDAKFQLDRTLFGMDLATDKVEKMVDIHFVVGAPDRKSGADKQGSDSSK